MLRQNCRLYSAPHIPTPFNTLLNLGGVVNLSNDLRRWTAETLRHKILHPRLPKWAQENRIQSLSLKQGGFRI